MSTFWSLIFGLVWGFLSFLSGCFYKVVRWDICSLLWEQHMERGERKKCFRISRPRLKWSVCWTKQTSNFHILLSLQCIHLYFHALTVEHLFGVIILPDKRIVEQQVVSVVGFVLGFGGCFLLFCSFSCLNWWLDVSFLSSSARYDYISSVMNFHVDVSLCTRC